MQNRLGIIALITVLLSFQVTTIGANAQVMVYQVHDRVLQSNESFSTDLELEPFAPHSIISEINVTDPAIIEPIITISIQDISLSGLTIFHRGDRPYSNLSWTPEASDYTIKIENNGEVDGVEVSIMITQTGPPENVHSNPEYLISSVLNLLLIMVVLPTCLMTALLLLYRHRQN